MADKPAAAPTADEVIAKLNKAIANSSALTLMPLELSALAGFVNKTIEQANEHAQMVSIISYRAYGQQSEMVH